LRQKKINFLLKTLLKRKSKHKKIIRGSVYYFGNGFFYNIFYLKIYQNNFLFLKNYFISQYIILKDPKA
jgi:hypothetical protein